MEEELDNPFEEQNEIKHSIERYEEMLRRQDSYFFDVDAFLNIIDYYIEKNDSVKALQVVRYATQQHPTSVEFLLRKAQLLAMIEKYDQALLILEQAEHLTPSQPDLFM